MVNNCIVAGPLGLRGLRGGLRGGFPPKRAACVFDRLGVWPSVVDGLASVLFPDGDLNCAFIASRGGLPPI